MNSSSFASLCPALLARKGGAKPAMRPQLGLTIGADNKLEPTNLEDLGWNDMGDGKTDDNVVPLPMADIQEAPVAKDPGSPVSEAIDTIVEQLSTPLKKKKKAKQAKAASGKRAAFTLRLDPERHLRLRLASTIAGSSAQQLVTEALDALLGDMPEIEELAAQVKRD